MAPYDVAAWWYIDAWRKSAGTWGAGDTWSRVYARGPFWGNGQKADAEYAQAMSVAFGALVRTFRWNGAAWELDRDRSFQPYG